MGYSSIFEFLAFVTLSSNVLPGFALPNVCELPGRVPQHGKIVIPDRKSYVTGTKLEIQCNPGFIVPDDLLPECEGRGWSRDVPDCYVNVAYRMPILHNIGVDIESVSTYSVDEKPETCSHPIRGTKKPYWTVDLIQRYTINHVSIVVKGEGLKVDFRIHVGDSPVEKRGTLLSCEERVIDKTESGKSYLFTCKHNPVGSHVTIETLGSFDNLRLCDIRIFSKSSLPSEVVCTEDQRNYHVESFENKCLMFIENERKTFDQADSFCKKHGGRLVGDMDNRMEEYIHWKSPKYRQENDHLSSKHSYWIAARRSEQCPSSWIWSSGNYVNMPVVDIDQNHKCLAIVSLHTKTTPCEELQETVCLIKNDPVVFIPKKSSGGISIKVVNGKTIAVTVLVILFVSSRFY